MSWDAAVAVPGTHLASQPELGLKWPGRCRDVGSALWERMVAGGLVPTEPQLQHGQFGPGSMVLLVPRRWQQTPAPKPQALGDKNQAALGDKNQGCWGFHLSGSIMVLAPVSTVPAPRVTRYGPKACGRAGTGNRTTDSPSRENGCRDRGHRCGDGPKRDFSHGCTLAALVPRVPPSHQSGVGRGSCLVPILNPASV